MDGTTMKTASPLSTSGNVSLSTSGRQIPLPQEFDDTPSKAQTPVAAAQIAAAAQLPVCGQMCPENDTSGNVEYKRMLLDPDESRLQHLVTQMKWRLCEGCGEAIYEVGIDDDGTPTGLTPTQMTQTLGTLTKMAQQIGAVASVVRQRQGISGAVAEVMVRMRNVRGETDTSESTEIRIATVGNVDSGKSTLMSVLTHGGLDDGRGLARVKVMRCQHEVTSGKTSCIATHHLMFNASGEILNYDDVTPTMHRDMDMSLFAGMDDEAAPEVAVDASGTPPPEEDRFPSKIIDFVDLAGHEKYLKTTLFGMTAHHPDYCMMTIGGNMGLTGMTKEHLGLAMALRIPIFFVVTKIDMCPPHVLKETVAQLKRITKSPGCKMVPYVVRTEDDAVVCARNFVNQRLAPIFLVSCVTGKCLDLLRSFLNLLPVQPSWAKASEEPLQFDITDDWSVPGVGTVVSGTVVGGVLRNNTTVLLGPDGCGQFFPVTIKSLYGNIGPVESVPAGGAASVALRKVARSAIRKGMVIVGADTSPVSCMEFTAEVLVLYHSTTIMKGYSSVIHCNNVRQAARTIAMDKELLRSGDKAVMTFRFEHHPEYLVPGSRLVFREGRAKGIGRVLSVTPYKAEDVPRPGKKKAKKSTVKGGKAGRKKGGK